VKKYLFFLRMMSSKGAPMHKVIGMHSAQSVAELCDELNNSDFITVDEIVYEGGTGPHRHVGQLAINQRIVGKVKEFFEREESAG
jgi:hypothetical protein